MTAKGMLPLLLTTSISLSMFVVYRSHFLQHTSRLLPILIVGSLHVAKHSAYSNEMVTQHGSVAHYTANLCSLSAPILWGVSGLEGSCWPHVLKASMA